MSDDRLLSALRRLSDRELPHAVDRKIRGRLETAWTTRSRGAAMPSFSIRRFAPVLAAFVLVLGFGGSALGASADSPLWETRLALESAGAYLRFSADDRVAYLLDLVQSRTEEAARQEVLGNAGAVAKARAAASAAAVEVNGNLPKVDVTLPVPTPAPTNSPSRSPLPSATPVPAVQPSSPARTTTPTTTPVRTNSPIGATEPPRTLTPVPTSTAKPPITITGVVRDSAGTNISGACVTTSPNIPTSTTSCIQKTTNGTYGFTSPSITPGQTITLYAYWSTSTGMLAGSATSQVTAPYTVMPAMTLTPRK